MYLYVDVSAMTHATAHGMKPEDIRGGPAAVAVGVISQITQFIRYHQAQRTYFCLDAREGSWRKHVDAAYKAQRKEQYKDDPERAMRREIAEQALATHLPELIDLLECPAFVMPFVEADDAAAAVVAMNATKPGVIITTDKDYWQLVTPTICVVNPVHQYRIELSPAGTLVKCKPDGQREELGITPEQHLLCKALQGDDSDNLVGICGCGEITAYKVVREGRAASYITEMTGQVTPRRSKTNPNPQPFHQDARVIVAHNVALMSLLKSQVHDKVKAVMQTIEAKAVRERRTNFTRLNLWLEQRGIQNPDVARHLSTTFTDQWIS